MAQRNRLILWRVFRVSSVLLLVFIFGLLFDAFYGLESAARAARNAERTEDADKLGAKPQLGKEMWREINIKELPDDENRRRTLPTKYRAYKLDPSAMEAALKKIGKGLPGSNLVAIPMPDGTFDRFRVVEAPVVEKGLSDKYPFLKTYSGQGIDDPSATLRFDFINKTFRAMVLSTRGTILVDPHPDGASQNYVSYFLSDSPHTGEEFSCPLDLASYHDSSIKDLGQADRNGRLVAAGDVQRTYVIAIGVTAEWTELMGGGTLAGGLARVVSILNRIDLFYERDAAIRLILAANNDTIIFVGSSPYNNNSLQQMLTQNKNILRSRLSGYDIGHAFGTKISGGAAGISLGIGLTCGGERESAVSKITEESGFDLLTPVHEIGHQMGAEHTFNKVDQRAPTAAFEPGFGYSIMSHGGDDIFGSFHVRSVEQIVAFTQAGFGSICGGELPTGNTIPEVTAQSGFNIPKQTPFSLTATATDADADTLTYAWQEYDLGFSSPPDTDVDGNVRPILRAYDPVSDPTRFFPSLSFIRNNGNVPPLFSTCNGQPCLTLESLPTITRTMQFQVLVRDNRSEFGAVNTALSVVNVDGGSGPFVLTSPNVSTDTQAGTPLVVTWDVANTTNPPVNAANVDIRLSTDGGLTFPITLAEATANDGSESVALPNLVTRRARIMVIGDENIFFDMSDANFAINDCLPGACGPLEITPVASNIPRGGIVAFESSGGIGGHNFSIVVNSSLGTIDLASGFFTAGPGTGTDVIRVTDAASAIADATVTTVAACLAGEKTWDGGGATNNWSEPSNWTCDDVPEVTGETVIFDVTSRKNVTIDVPVTIPSWKIAKGYTGTITITDGIDFTTTETGGFVQSDGTLNGGSGTITAPTIRQDGGTFNGGSGNMIVSDKFEFLAGSFNAPSGNLDIQRAFSTTGGIFSPGAGTVRFLGNGTGNISVTSGFFNNVTLDSTGPRVLTGQILSFGTLRLVRGAFSGGTLNVAGNMVIESTYDDNTAAPAKMIFSGNGFGTYLNNGGVTPRGEWVVDGVTTLSSDLDLSVHNGSVLRLTSGRVITGNFKVNAGTRTIVRTNGHVAGNLRRDFSTTGAKVFNVGSGGQQDPVTVTVLAPISGTQGMTVGFSGFPDPNMNQLTSLLCHWELTEHGTINANLSFTYVDGCDFNGIENQASVAKISGGVVNFTADPINAPTNTFTILNETDFVSYSIGIDPSPCPSGQRLWDGGGTTNNWSEAANWACDLAPQNGNNIIFDATSLKNNVIDVPISVNSFRINSGFTGSVTLGSSNLMIADFIQSDGTFSGGSGSINITGTFTQSGGTFSGGIGPVSITGAFNRSGGAFIATSGSTSFASNFKQTGGTFAHNGGTVVFIGNTASNINQGLPVTTTETFNNLTFQRTGIVILKVNGVLNVLGNLNLTSGQVQADVIGSTLKANGDVAVGSNFNGLIPLSHVGSADQTITTGVISDNPWNSWIVDKSAGKVTLASNLRWPGGLQSFIFRNGQIDTGNFALDVGGATGFAENGYVIGNLRKTISFTKSFEVGTASGYSPVTISPSTTGTFTVRANDGTLTGVDPENSIGRNWTITTSSGVPFADVTFQYTDADVPATANEANFKFIRRSGTLNEVFEPSIVDTAANTFTLTNVTQFSDWSLGQLVPTAAAVSVSGRVSAPSGAGIARARITIADLNGNIRAATTNPFGYYIIPDVVAGQTYVVSVSARRYAFSAPVRVINVNDYITDLNFVSDN